MSGALLLVIFAGAALRTASTNVAQGSPVYPSCGVLYNYDEAGLTVRGYTKCYDAPYSDATTEANLEACQSMGYTYAFVGAKNSSNATQFNIGAFGKTSNVFNQTDTSTTAVSGPGGAYWYNNPQLSFGFAASSVVNLFSCDYGQGPGDCESRLCWHLNNNGGGFRAGCTIFLDDPTWRKVIYLGNETYSCLPELQRISVEVVPQQQVIYEGTVNLTLRCKVHLDSSGVVGVEWFKDGMPLEATNNTEITMLNLTALSSVHTYVSNVTHRVVTIDDAGSYICNVTYFSLNDSELHSLISDEEFINVEAPPVVHTITLLSIVPHGGEGRDVYNISCIATTPEGLALYKEFVWNLSAEKKATINITSSNTKTSNSYGASSNSIHETSFTSAASVSVSCTTKLYYGVDLINAATEYTDTLYLPGPIAPVEVENITARYSFELAIISWIVPNIAYTPETYTVMYSTSPANLNLTAGQVYGDSLLSQTYKSHSVTLQGLSSNTTYFYTIISSNSYGTVMSSQFFFKTLTNDIYQVQNYNAIPIGAQLEINVTVLATLEYGTSIMFIALDHIPAQFPLITSDYDTEVNVTYNQIGLSLNGNYVLCFGDTCGSKIIVNITVPKLHLSSSNLIALTDLTNGNGVSITCLPSDLRAPVKWNIANDFPDVSVTYFPDGLFHTVTFYSAPQQSFTIQCDLVDIEREIYVDPQEATVRFISSPIVILRNGFELLSDPIINNINASNITPLHLTCLSIEGHGNLSWMSNTTHVNSSMMIATNDQNVTLTVQEFANSSIYSCVSQLSGYSAYVTITFQNPVWDLLSSRNASVPVGLNFNMQYKYADISNGYLNLGPGFLIEIYFTSFYSLTMSELIYSGNTNQSVNFFHHNVTSTTYAGGFYTINVTYLGNGEVFSDIIELITFVPEFIGGQNDVYTLMDSNVTLNCTPSDSQTPVFWAINSYRGEGRYDLTNYPEYFTFPPDGLNHTVTFDVANVLSYFSTTPVSFICYLFDYARTQYITVNTQNARVQIYQTNAGYEILNNSIINYLPFNDLPGVPAPSKRDEEPVWLSTNALVTDSVGQVMDNATLGIFITSQTTSTSELTFSLFVIESIAGTYRCQSRQSGSSSNFFLTAENPYLKFDESPVINAYLGDEIILTFKAAYDSTGMDDSINSDGNITLDFASSSKNGSVKFNTITPTMSTVNNYYFYLGEVNVSYAGTYTVTLESQSSSFSAISDNITLLVTEPKLITSHDSITLLVGDSTQLSCHTSVGHYKLHWVIYAPFSPNTYLGNTGESIALYVNSASTSNSGKYGCVLMSAGTILQKNITIHVLKACPRNAFGGIIWEKTAENTVMHKQCTQAGTLFRAGAMVSRYCQVDGTWARADFTSCTLVKPAIPFALVWLAVEANNVAEVQNEQTVLEGELRARLDRFHVPYRGVTLHSLYLASVALTFQIIPLTTNSTFTTTFGAFLLEFLDNQNVSSIGGYQIIPSSGGYIAVQPGESCPCVSNENLASNFFQVLCNTASLSPCSCNFSVCQCKDPYVGDGFTCTLDTDGDGYPDVNLDSCTPENQNKYCKKDNCPIVYNPEQDINDCVSNFSSINQGFEGCPFGPDPVWNVTWANTLPGTTDVERCPGGVESFGNAMRFCNIDGTWDEAIVTECGSLTFKLILEQTTTLLGSEGLSYDQLLMNGDTILMQLIVATSPNASTISILPLDLNTTNTILASMIQALSSGLQLNNTGYPSLAIVDVLNNVLDKKNLDGWQQLQTIESGSQSLLYNSEQYAAYLAQASQSSIVLGRSNIVMSASRVTIDDLADILFPKDGDLENSSFASNQLAKIVIPKELILERLKMNANTNKTSAPIANILFNNINTFLPANNSRQRASSLVISSQIYGSEGRISTALLYRPVSFNFTLVQERMQSDGPQCVFWNFSTVLKNGSWSNAGVLTSSISNGNGTVSISCTSTHLTSFAVLVDVAGGLQGVPANELAALNVVAYIGCAISILSLTITIIFFLYQGKRLLSAVHLFIHLNLCISLLLAYVVFVIGIETGNRSTGGCALVAALLHYLFLSSFAWMLCEGVMLYLMLVVVFSALTKKWWAFLIIGYGIPLPFVVIGIASRHAEYGVRDKNGSLQYCWLSTMYGTIWAFVAPMLAIIIINCVFFVFALRAIGKSKSKKTDTEGKNRKLAISLLKSSLVLLPLLGLTWIIGLLTINKYSTTLAWIFTILNSSQGTAIFLFHVIRNEKVWARIVMLCKRFKKATLKNAGKYEVNVSNATMSKKDIESVTIKMNDYVPSSVGLESGTSQAPLDIVPKEVTTGSLMFSNATDVDNDHEKDVESNFSSRPPDTIKTEVL